MFKMKALICLGLGTALLAGCGGGASDLKTNDCTVGVNSCNVPPAVNAGAPQNVLVGSTVTLDGSGTSDANNDPLSYSWSILQTPTGSTAALASTTSVKTTFVPERAGQYVITLSASDGKSSATASTTINASATNLTINSTSYTNGGPLPLRIAAASVGGSNLSPQLNISDVPTGTKRFAIVMDDETAPCQTGLSACRHWGVFNLPVAKTAIAEGENLLLQNGVVYGSNYTIGVGGAAGIGYAGPAATSTHTYKLTVYALTDNVTWVTAVPEYNRAKFELDFKDYIIGKATLTGTFP
jgi:Raf kinase inhibitor-like YbhB/YbcL family protein